MNSLPLLDHHREQQNRPDARDRDRRRALYDHLERGVAHRQMRPRIAETITIAMIIGPPAIKAPASPASRPCPSHHAGAGEGLGAEEDPGDVDQEEGEEREADDATRPGVKP